MRSKFLQVDSQAINTKRGENRKGKRREKQGSSAAKATLPPRDRNESGSKDSSDGTFTGRFSTPDKTRCTWVATGIDVFVLDISCKKRTKTFDCEYTAKPRSCPEYASRAKVYWKQIVRSLKRLKKPCHNSKELVQTSVCRNAPKDAHFKLSTAPQIPLQPQPRNKSCADLADRQKLAEDYCGGAWSSLCTFFFAMVETENC
ncbi:fibroblast growth factor-binding protein 1 isoform X2 [Electrophorus electricus]|uniref:fibroblast growth factor-binding protein 1 isoform X2 n=1 Tax=Electrophorus electricus TaxID=8005 RepID=UPI0015D04624|nr:fibroblast growth factor-binding protein 1 isoform X2 [Electrophorus electricus]